MQSAMAFAYFHFPFPAINGLLSQKITCTTAKEEKTLSRSLLKKTFWNIMGSRVGCDGFCVKYIFVPQQNRHGHTNSILHFLCMWKISTGYECGASSLKPLYNCVAAGGKKRQKYWETSKSIGYTLT